MFAPRLESIRLSVDDVGVKIAPAADERREEIGGDRSVRGGEEQVCGDVEVTAEDGRRGRAFSASKRAGTTVRDPAESRSPAPGPAPLEPSPASDARSSRRNRRIASV